MTTKKEIAKLTKMKLNELQAKFAEVVGEKTRSPNRKFLMRKITEALLGAASGGAGEKATAPTVSATTEATVATNTTATPATEQVAEIVSEKLTKLTVPELQARYLEVVGRPTGSSDKPYLLWKIREARKGRVPIGPRKNAKRDDVAFKVLPLRMEAAIVDKLDEAWKRQGLHSRTDLFRRSLAAATAGASPAGPAHKRSPVRIVLDPDAHPVAKGKLCGQHVGFNLHAQTKVAANDKKGRENLCKYILRPPLANDRLKILDDKLVRLEFKKPWSDDYASHCTSFSLVDAIRCSFCSDA
jgi:hypothetical protein